MHTSPDWRAHSIEFRPKAFLSRGYCLGLAGVSSLRAFSFALFPDLTLVAFKVFQGTEIGLKQSFSVKGGATECSELRN